MAKIMPHISPEFIDLQPPSFGPYIFILTSSYRNLLLLVLGEKGVNRFQPRSDHGTVRDSGLLHVSDINFHFLHRTHPRPSMRYGNRLIDIALDDHHGKIGVLNLTGTSTRPFGMGIRRPEKRSVGSIECRRRLGGLLKYLSACRMNIFTIRATVETGPSEASLTMERTRRSISVTMERTGRFISVVSRSFFQMVDDDRIERRLARL
jgi:hypothetical protein